MINWTNFTPLSALIGGLMIGLSVSMLLLFNGKIAGISGIVAGLFKTSGHERNWRLAFVLGLIISPMIYQLFSPLPVIEQNIDTLKLIIAGLLVGLGTSYASGCTSGHGICGLARLSKRSLVATLLFMLAGFVTVFVTQHLLT